MKCKLLWIKASDKRIFVNVNKILYDIKVIMQELRKMVLIRKYIKHVRDMQNLY